MRQRFLALVIASLTLGLVFARGQDPAERPIRPSDGANIFRNYCASCHGATGRGDGPAAKALKQTVPDLTTLARRNGGAFPADHVRTIVMFGGGDPISAHGSKSMPIWGPVFHEIEFDSDLGSVRLENITKYLESIQRK